MIKVLLVSPRLPNTDPRRCGDHTYTDLMLNYPPRGVRYFHYEDLIASGQARRIRSLQALSHYFIKVGVLPPDVWFEAIETEIVPDIIHIYGFSAVVRLPQRPDPVPVVLGSSTGGYSDLKYYHGWNESAIRRMRKRKRRFLKLVHAHDSSLLPERATSVLTWSAFSRSIHLAEGYVRPEQISVVYPGLPAPVPSTPRIRKREELTFLFVGRDFERKNGDLVIRAFREVHALYPLTRLWLISQPIDGRMIVSDGIFHRHFVPHEELLTTIFPKADVLLLPSRSEGFGLALVEAMAQSLCIIASDVGAIPEIVRDGMNGFLVNADSEEELKARMLYLAENRDVVLNMQRHSREYFLRRFSSQVHNTQLRNIYCAALSR